jgi:hypothetical protein
MAPSRNATDVLVFTDLPEKSLHNAVKRSMPDGSAGYVIKDINYSEHADPFSTDILLKFDKVPEKYVKDDSGKYDIYSANYQFLKEGVGNGCASFFKSDHGIMINTSEGLWLGSTEDLGSFNIEFRFNAAELKNGSILFSRIGYFSGVKKGIEIKLKDSGVSAYFYNMFKTPGGALKSVSLARGGRLNKGNWYHFSLSFDRMSGKLTKLLNDNEEDVAYMTVSGGAFSEVFIPLFGYIDDEDGSSRGTDLPLAVIGKNYSGLMDEFRISYKHYNELKNSTDIALNKYKGSEYAGRVPYNREGFITSPVKEFPSTGTAITDFSWDEILNPGTFIWMELRVADKYFSDNDTSVKWYKVTPGQKKIFSMRGDDGEYLRGRYFQWRAHLTASPEGDKSPVMKKVTVKYRVDHPPVVPYSFEAAGTGDKYIILRWKRNVEEDLGGYKIYYGTKKGSYDGIITTVNGRKITNDMAEGNYITVRIDNAVVEENKTADTRNVLVYPSIENTVLYYFSVTSYDSYRLNTVYNHESDLSSSIQARPYAGSDIR